MLQAKDIGEMAYKAFCEKRLSSNPPKVKFHNTISTAMLKTFTHLNKKTEPSGNPQGRQKVVCSNDCHHRKQKLTDERSVIPSSRTSSVVIGYPRWLDAQDKQSVHGKRTPERRQAGDSIPQPSAFTIGGMALVQCLKGDRKTFAAVPETVLRKVLNEGGTSDRVDVIFDDYREESVKNAEQENRGEGSTLTLLNAYNGSLLLSWQMLAAFSITQLLCLFKI